MIDLSHRVRPEETVWFPAFAAEDRIAPERWRMRRPYGYEWTHDGWEVRLIVPRGFVYDGASVPTLGRLLVSKHLLHKYSAHHDLPYRYAGRLPRGCHLIRGHDGWDSVEYPWTRGEADRLMGAMMRADPQGPGKVRRWLTIRGVMRAGEGSWGRHAPVLDPWRDPFRGVA